jgi:hypothetical protein
MPASTQGRCRFVSSELGLRLRSWLFRGRSRSGLHRRVAGSGRHHAGSAARRSSRSAAARGSRSTASRGGRSAAGRRRSATRLNRSTAATGAVTAALATAMVVVVMVMVAATAATATAATAAIAATTTAATAAVREQACGRRAWSSDQERRAGHHGQHESLAKHQRSPHLFEVFETRKSGRTSSAPGTTHQVPGVFQKSPLNLQIPRRQLA